MSELKMSEFFSSNGYFIRFRNISNNAIYAKLVPLNSKNADAYIEFNDRAELLTLEDVKTYLLFSTVLKPVD